ncbi:MAG TPA: hypothetical protein VN088_01045 [Nocardioides sp.]|nr:hypothetical protein [Nocardioides sp.]
MKRSLLVCLSLSVLAACGTNEAPASAPAPTVSRPAPPSLRQIVHDTRSRLDVVAVAPGPEGFTVSAWWSLRRGRRDVGAIVTSDDGFRSAHYERAGYRAWSRHAPAIKVHRPHVPLLRHLIATPVVSLSPGLRAFTGGGDGATLYPFGAVARSVHGAPWVGYVVPPRDGDRAYQSGAAILPDGRFLVLLDAWSSDRGAKPGPEHHGLWVSRGTDWTGFVPFRPVFSPPLGTSERIEMLQAARDGSRYAPHGFVYLMTSGGRVYVSTDDARTFTSIPARSN